MKIVDATARVTVFTGALLLGGAVVGPAGSGRAEAQTCVGDCSGDGQVTVDEIVTMVNIALGQAAVSTCAAGDPSGDGQITVDEILQAVNNALNGCGSSGECTTATVTVLLDYDPLSVPDLAGVQVELDYPIASVSIPGSNGDESVTARVMDITGAGGALDVQDLDTDSDGTDDQLRTSYVLFGASLSPGGFEAVEFDCEAGASVPVVEDFVCDLADASDGTGFPVSGIGCSVQVTLD
jgi:hypothetical protein